MILIRRILNFLLILFVSYNIFLMLTSSISYDFINYAFSGYSQSGNVMLFQQSDEEIPNFRDRDLINLLEKNYDDFYIIKQGKKLGIYVSGLDYPLAKQVDMNNLLLANNKETYNEVYDPNLKKITYNLMSSNKLMYEIEDNMISDYLVIFDHKLSKDEKEKLSELVPNSISPLGWGVDNRLIKPIENLGIALLSAMLIIKFQLIIINRLRENIFTYQLLGLNRYKILNEIIFDFIISFILAAGIILFFNYNEITSYLYYDIFSERIYNLVIIYSLFTLSIFMAFIIPIIIKLNKMEVSNLLRENEL